VDVEGEHLAQTLRRAAEHRGAAFVEIFQNCKIFNDGVFEYATDKAMKADHILYLEHGQPLLFGKDRNKALRLNGLDAEIVEFPTGSPPSAVLNHDERAERPALARLLAGLAGPVFPECLGVFRNIAQSTFEQELKLQATTGPHSSLPSVDDLFASEDTWTVDEK
jgi:2-oxoglutarate ferredoxin oxidoreductase subunit beta